MQPFLLAFVDSQAFKLMSLAMLVPYVLVGAVVVWLLVLLTRSGLRSPTVAATGWQYAGRIVRLVPAVCIGFVGLMVWLSEVHSTHLASRGASAYAEALHRKEVGRQAKVAGRYILADAELPAPNQSWPPAANDQALADTTRLAAEPYVELWLRPNGTFTYYSTLEGDEAGAQATGRWHLRADTRDKPETMMALRKLHTYAIVLDMLPPPAKDTAPLSGSLADEEDPPTVKLAGTYQLQGSSLPFALEPAPSPLAPLAQQMPPALSPF
jgi:hypothetical protein